MDLFEQSIDEELRKRAPLAQRMRPRTLAEFRGQDHLLAQSKVLRSFVDSGSVPSMILWGPPGCGKTTLARILAESCGKEFICLSAIMAGVGDIKKEVTASRERVSLSGRETVLFIDEIHRFNKVQQDALLPHVESGLLTLIGATTENPSFEIIPPLVSRLRIFMLESLTQDDLVSIMEQAMQDRDRGLGSEKIKFEEGKKEEILQLIAKFSNGDARTSLNILEAAVMYGKAEAGGVITRDKITEIVQKVGFRYDKSQEEHYNTISAFIKSMRGSAPDAALYYLARLLEGGEDPRFITRRMVIFASEDIGNADPHALMVAVAAADGVRFVGLPEAQIILGQAVSYLASAPKSNASYMALKKAREFVKETGNLPVPFHLRNNAPPGAQGGKQKGYLYPHDYPGNHVKQDYFPEGVEERFYYPGENGIEKNIKARLEGLRKSGKE